MDSHNTANTASTFGKSSNGSRRTSATRSRVGSMKRKHSTADKRKMVCSLPRAPKPEAQKATVMAQIFNENTGCSFVGHIEDEPATQIPPSFNQKVINPGLQMVKQHSSPAKEVPLRLESKFHTEEKRPRNDMMEKAKDMKACLDLQFELIRKIDEGTYAKVYYAKDWKRDGKEVVVKLLRNRATASADEREQVKTEMRNHRVLSHKNIIRMYGGNMKGDMYIWGKKQEQRFVYLVTEYLGSEFINMFDLIEVAMGNGLSEDCGRYFMKQMLSAMHYIHEDNATCHRDLKLENILIDKDMQFKILDFGLSCKGDLKNMTGAVGSPNYVAPEILSSKYYDGSKADLFSLGVLLFIIVIGKFPHG
jgi:hypothetical protein